MTKSSVLTIKLGKELAVYANDITDIYVTKDYIGALRNEYLDHVLGVTNGFTSIVDLLIALERKGLPEPCDQPLADIQESREEFKFIVRNRGAYSVVVESLRKYCNRKDPCGLMVYDFLTYLRKPDGRFTDVASKFDRYMGEHLTVSTVLKAVKEYGVLSGLVDYYNIKEAKDEAEEAEEEDRDL